MDKLLLNSDNVLQLKLKNGNDNSDFNTATVYVTLYDTSGTEIPDETWPINMSYVAGSAGLYRATIADTVGLVDKQLVDAVIEANGGSGLYREFNKRMQVVKG